MPTISILPGEASWRSRKVRYYSGNWSSIETILPEFDLVPFNAGPDEPANPFLLKVMRSPLSAAERPIPVGIVSQTYTLVSHRKIAALCRECLIELGIEPEDLRYEVGLSELGEWMNFRVYFPDSYAFMDAHGNKLDLRLECFNSVDGSSRLMILFGWLRFVCSNGLVIGETRIEIKERHGQGLDLDSIGERILPAFEAVEADKSRMRTWQQQKVGIRDIAAWADERYQRNGEKRQPRGSSTSANLARTLSCKTRSRLVLLQKSRSATSIACQALLNAPRQSMMSLRRCRSSRRVGTMPRNASPGRQRFRISWNA
jgi:Domain of unknown function (DUF932)